MSMNSRWYVIHTYSSYENKVKENILKVAENRGMQDEILDVVIPVEVVEEVNENKKNGGKKSEPKTRNLFPGYVMVKIAVEIDEDNVPSISNEAWFVIRNTRGVTGFVGPEGKPTPLSEEEASRLGVEVHTVEVNYKVGDTVRTNHAVYGPLTGTVESIDLEEEIVRIDVTALFGKKTVVDCGLDELELITD